MFTRPARRTTRPLLVPVLAAVLIALAGCSRADGSGGAVVKGVTEIVVKADRFTPGTVEIPAGTRLTWRFEDGSVPHDVTGIGWKSGKPQAKGTFSAAFDRPGTYPYRCTIHPGMTGKVVVSGG
jgi:plastocyanin